VHTDWYGWLPEAKLSAFRVYASEFEACYMMLSVSLNEAIGLRDSGALRKSFQMIEVTPALCARLIDRLQALLYSLDQHAKHYGIVPSVAPLNVADFHGLRAQRSARMNSMLNRVLLSQRAQFLKKIASLKDLLADLGGDFREAAEELASGSNLDCRALWIVLDDDHFDLNTCFRESMVLLKCFLRVLPDDQLLPFQKSVEAHMDPRQAPAPERRLLRHRRTPQFARE
jgi:hypothetical protein